MNLEYKPKPYKKVDGIYESEEGLTKWQKFCVGFMEFIGKGLAGRWELNLKIKF